MNFKGEFDGQGFLISDLSINKPSVENVGFFGKTIGATIENLRVEGPLVYGFKRVGGLVGLAYGGTKIRNCETNIRIETPEAGEVAGGLVGWLWDNSEISNSSSNGSVTGGKQLGGLAGRTHTSLVSSSSSRAHVFSKRVAGGMVGGLIGNDDFGIIEKSFATGNVYTPATSAGGFIGAASKTTIKKSFSTGNVKAKDIVGGFAGYLVERQYSLWSDLY